MVKKELKGFRIHHFENKEGVLIPEGSIFVGFSSRQFSLGGEVQTISWVNWAVPLSAYDITKKIKQKNKVKGVVYTFTLKPIL